MARLPRADRNLVHVVAMSAMSSLLSSSTSRTELSITAKNKRTTFEKQLASTSYDIAIAIVEEGDSRS